MNRLVAWFAQNGVAANLLMWVIIGGGAMTLILGGLKQEIFPEFSSDTIKVTVEYLGAAPEEVEEGVCMRVEEAIQGLPGVRRITSSAVEGFGTVTVELLPGADSRQLLEEVKARVDTIDTFPDETERPIVQEVILRRQVIDVAVSADTDEKTLRKIAERVRDEIAALPGISYVQLANARPYEISIEISEEALRRYGLTFDQVAQAVRRSSLDLPGGSVKTAGGEILVRTKGQAYEGTEYEKLPLITRPDGTRLVLADVAEVIDGFEDTDQASRFDGKPVILVEVYRVGEQSALGVAETVHAYVDEARQRMSEGVSLTLWQDDSAVLLSRIDLLVRNAKYGLLLVFLLLALFLRLRLAFWVALGIPISFLGAVWFLPGLDISINLISLFAFIVVLGIVVDDAIIVGENIYRHHQRGKNGLDAAISGARQVAVPVVFAVLTTVASFSPLLNVPGNMGKIMKVIPSIVIATLVISLVESLLILPRHLSHLRPDQREPRGILGLWARFQALFTTGLEKFVDHVYRPILRFGLRWRYLTLSVGASTLLLTGGFVAGGWIKFVFFPPVDADNMVAFVTMPQGTPAELTAEAIARIEDAAGKLRRELASPDTAGQDLFRHVLSSVGGQPFREAQALRGGTTRSFRGGHLGEVNVELIPSEERRISSTEIARRWRELTGPIPDAIEVSFTASLFSSGEAINIQLAASELRELRTAAEKLKAKIGSYDGIFDIKDSFRAGKQELKLAIQPRAEALGLSLADLARQVRQGFYGEEAQRIQRGRDDVRVMVRYPERERRSLQNVENLRVRLPQGIEVPFTGVAVASLGRGYAAINRADRQRVINVTADVDQKTANANEILEDLKATTLPQLQQEHPGLTYSFEGEQREQQDALRGLRRGFLFAILLIYALLAIPFRSYGQPLIVMSAIPFGLVGAVWGHLIMGMDLTLLSLFGLVALTGVLVNDSLVLVDFINRSHRSGTPLRKALHEAGAARFRPILLTSLTTFAGLTPLLLEKSLQAQFLIPMATSLGFGVLFATFITLMLVPAGYLVLEDVKRQFRLLFADVRRLSGREGPG